MGILVLLGSIAVGFFICFVVIPAVQGRISRPGEEKIDPEKGPDPIPDPDYMPGVMMVWGRYEWLHKNQYDYYMNHPLPAGMSIVAPPVPTGEAYREAQRERDKKSGELR